MGGEEEEEEEEAEGGAGREDRRSEDPGIWSDEEDGSCASGTGASIRLLSIDDVLKKMKEIHTKITFLISNAYMRQMRLKHFLIHTSRDSRSLQCSYLYLLSDSAKTRHFLQAQVCVWQKYCNRKSEPGAFKKGRTQHTHTDAKFSAASPQCRICPPRNGQVVALLVKPSTFLEWKNGENKNNLFL